MVRLCIVCNKTQPSYNLPNEKTATHCAKCKLDGMIDIKHKKCIVCNKTRPIYNLPNEKTATHCAKCKLDSMINIKDKKCIVCNKTIPNYNLPNEKTATHCAKCKLDGMINIVSKMCIVCNKTQPIYNLPNEKTATHCAKCKLDGMINIKDKRCKTYLCDIIPSKKYDGYCVRCFMHTFPDKTVSRNYKTKESATVQHIKSSFPNLQIITDKRVACGCSSRRPDVFIDLFHQVIIVEIDENQHIQYDCSCENKRIMQLSQDINHRPLVFIRFNPDSYKTTQNKTITSCWTLNKLGLCVVKKTKQDEWRTRLNELSNSINYWLEHKTSKLLEVVQLYYDEE